MGWIIMAYLSGIATGILFRSKISTNLRAALSWGRKAADEVEKKL